MKELSHNDYIIHVFHPRGAINNEENKNTKHKTTSDRQTTDDAHVFAEKVNVSLVRKTYVVSFRFVPFL